MATRAAGLIALALAGVRGTRVGPAPAPAPAGPKLEAVAVTFEIANYNYDDLDEPLEQPSASSLAHQSKVSTSFKVDDGHWTGNTGKGLAKYTAAASGDSKKETLKVSMHGHHHKGKKHHKVEDESFLELGIEELVRDVLRDHVRETFDELVEKFLPAAGPAAASPAAAFLSGGAGPAPAPAPAEPSHVVDVFVQFQPGKQRPLSQDKNYNGKSIHAEVTITGRPGTQMDEMPGVEAALNKSRDTGDMELWLAGELFESTGIVPQIEGLKVAKTQIPQWFEGNTCEKHMKTVVQRFTLAYTRRMVPAAIYNECTNYMPLMSFSHDNIPNGVDRKRCREATENFAKQWNFGKDATGKKVEADFGKFCLDICEAKYGAGAQQCHVSKGDQLALKGP